MTQTQNGMTEEEVIDRADLAWDRLTDMVTQDWISDSDRAKILRMLEQSCATLARSYENQEPAVPELAAGEEVKLSPGVTMILTVTRDGVTEIRLLPDQTGIPLFVDLVRDGQEIELVEEDERKVEAAREYVGTHIWKPLLDLPPSIVWEG